MKDFDADGFERRCHEYLEGRLPVEQATRFERDLLLTDHSEVFRETLALRDLLQCMGPEDAPDGLVERIQIELGVHGLQTERTRASRPRARTRDAAATSLEASLIGLRWMFRGPAMAATVAAGPALGRGQALAGASTLRYSLGPLALGSGFPAAAEPQKKRTSQPLWRRALARAWNR